MRDISRTYGNIILQKIIQLERPLYSNAKMTTKIYIVPFVRSNYQSNTTIWLLQPQETFHTLTTRSFDGQKIKGQADAIKLNSVLDTRGQRRR